MTKNSGGTITDNRSWVLDANSNWTSRTTNGATTSYTYDPANQLRGITGVGLYAWDANGNLLSGSNRSYNYNSADQTTSISEVALSYTGLGQMERVTRGSDSYKYNTLGIGSGLERGGKSLLFLNNGESPHGKSRCAPDGRRHSIEGETSVQ